ncbi:MAG: transketolase [Acidobacteria bacterium]|nr:transketolase [Acidobacteriota bacterium]
MTVPEMEVLGRRIRGRLIEMSHRARTPHLASTLSCVEILVAAYWEVLALDPRNASAPERDRFILSKGHAATALYVALAYRGFFPEALLDTFAEPGSRLAEQPSPGCVPGLELATGSLGHGLPVGVGMAFAGRLQGLAHRVFVLMSDGECNEGSAWEAALLAPAQRLDRVAAIIDYNKWQATGRSNEIMALHPLREKWEAFGWSSYEVDGHDLKALIDVMAHVPDGSGKPVAIVAHTVKGKGVSFMEDDNNWHYRAPDADQVRRAKAELGLL